jgi:hypothetical protein
MKHGGWCHIEIPTSKRDEAQKFYGGVFGWTFTHIPEMNYTIYSAGEGEVGGGLFDPPAGVPRMITNYINVTDLDASAKKVAECGGKVLGERIEVGSHGWMRMISDPDGNVLSLWQSKPRPAPAKKAAKKGGKKKR